MGLFRVLGLVREREGKRTKLKEVARSTKMIYKMNNKQNRKGTLTFDMSSFLCHNK